MHIFSSFMSWVDERELRLRGTCMRMAWRVALTIVCSVHYWNSFIMCVSRGWHHIRVFTRVSVWCFFFLFLCTFCLTSTSCFYSFFHSLACSIRISFHSIANKIINNRVKIMAFGFFFLCHTLNVLNSKLSSRYHNTSSISLNVVTLSISLQALVWLWARAALFRNQHTIG